MELFGINLTAGRETYVVGDVISGEVIIQSSKDEVIEDLVVSICGVAHVEWKKCFTKYQETESYYNVKKTLIDVTSARKERKLSRRVPWVKYFELDVPEDTFPPNFHSDHGYIRNDVTLTLKLKGGKEHVTSRPFKIIDVTSLATHFEDGQRPCSQTIVLEQYGLMTGSGHLLLCITAKTTIPGQLSLGHLLLAITARTTFPDNYHYYTCSWLSHSGQLSPDNYH
eukprot:XP_011677598.1 PREDICTED: uncharacterized protein LOC100889094 [Strongylocentrotus purpuratus]